MNSNISKIIEHIDVINVIKNYSCYKSLWNHNKQFHIKNILKSNGLVTEKNKKELKSLICIYCNKEFKHKQNKWEHEKNVCLPKHENKINNNKYKILEKKSSN